MVATRQDEPLYLETAHARTWPSDPSAFVRDDLLGGEPPIRGRRIGVRSIHALDDERGLRHGEVVQKFDLEADDVHPALEYGIRLAPRNRRPAPGSVRTSDRGFRRPVRRQAVPILRVAQGFYMSENKWESGGEKWEHSPRNRSTERNSRFG